MKPGRPPIINPDWLRENTDVAWFPKAPKGKTDQPCIVIPNSLVVKMYKQRYSLTREINNANKVMRTWFTAAAKELGWSQIKWYPDWESNSVRGYAALLVYKHNETRTVSQ